MRKLTDRSFRLNSQSKAHQEQKRTELEWGTEALLDQTLAALEKGELFLIGDLR